MRNEVFVYISQVNTRLHQYVSNPRCELEAIFNNLLETKNNLTFNFYDVNCLPNELH